MECGECGRREVHSDTHLMCSSAQRRRAELGGAPAEVGGCKLTSSGCPAAARKGGTHATSTLGKPRFTKLCTAWHCVRGRCVVLSTDTPSAAKRCPLARSELALAGALSKHNVRHYGAVKQRTSLLCAVLRIALLRSLSRLCSRCLQAIPQGDQNATSPCAYLLRQSTAVVACMEAANFILRPHAPDSRSTCQPAPCMRRGGAVL